MSVFDEPTLRRMYVDEGLTIRQIARALHTSTKTVLAALDQYGIERRSRGPRRRLEQATLRRMYVDERQTIREISMVLGVAPGTVCEALERYGIERRKAAPRRDRPPLSPEEHRELRKYVEALGIRRAARHYKTSRLKIYARLGWLPPPGLNKPQLDDQLVREVYEAGTAAGRPATMIVADLARQWGCSESTVWRSLQRTSVRPPEREKHP